MSGTLAVGGLTFEVRRSSRRRTLNLTVDRGGELVIHGPAESSDKELTAWVSSKLLWVHRKLALKAADVPRVRTPEFVTGESFKYLGRACRLSVLAQQEKSLCFDGRRFFLRRDAIPTAMSHFRAWYIATGRAWITNRVALLAKSVGAVPTRIGVLELGFRWGSCGRNGVVYFNWKLLQLPVRLADYVIAHELCHIKEPRHGPEFWRALERALPDWKDRQAILKVSAAEIYWCHPGMSS